MYNLYKNEERLCTKSSILCRKPLMPSLLSPPSHLSVMSSLLSLPLNHHQTLFPKPLQARGDPLQITKPRGVRAVSFRTTALMTSITSNFHPSGSKCSLSELSPLEAVFFDIDGTLCDSDPIHYYALREMLQEVGFNGGVPITEDFFAKNISGKDDEAVGTLLFPGWDHEKAMKFMDDNEAMFRRLASQQLKAVNGLHKLCKWIEDRGLKRAAVSNAPRVNAEFMISMLGLADFFQLVVLGSECDRAKPFPDPYLKALKDLQDSASGIKSGVAAGMSVVGLTTRNPEQLLIDAGATFLIKDYEDPKLFAALEEIRERISD